MGSSQSFHSDAPSLAVAFVVREKFSWALASLQRLDRLGGAPFSLYLVDCGYPREIRAEIDSYLSGRARVHVIESPRYLLPNESLNLVIERAEEELICLVQNDVLVEEHFLSELVSTQVEQGCEVVWPETFEVMDGQREPHRDEYTDDALYEESGVMKVQQKVERPARSGQSPVRSIQHIEMHAVLFTRAFLKQLAPLPAINSREHIDLAIAAYKAGARIFVNERARANYVLPPIYDWEADYFSFRWDVEMAHQSHVAVLRKWNVDPMPSAMGFVKEHALHARPDRRLRGLVRSQADIVLPSLSAHQSARH